MSKHMFLKSMNSRDLNGTHITCSSTQYNVYNNQLMFNSSHTIMVLVNNTENNLLSSSVGDLETMPSATNSVMIIVPILICGLLIITYYFLWRFKFRPINSTAPLHVDDKEI